MKKRTRKSVLITATIVLLGAVVLAIFLLNKKPPQHTPEPISQVVVEGVGASEGKEPMSGSGTLATLRAWEEDLECQVVYERSAIEGNIEGTAFFSKGNIRTDFVVPAPEFGGTITSSMIIGGDSMYVWSVIDGKLLGFKTKPGTQSKDIDTKEPVPMDVTVRYTCTSWPEVDGSVFVPPASVEFKDLAPIIKAGPEDSVLPN